MTAERPPNETQISQSLPGVTRHITGHSQEGKAIVESSSPGSWTPLLGDSLAFNVVYTTSEFPVSLNNNKDIMAHDNLMASKQLGLVNPNGTICRIVDFAPGSDPLMHRTQSLDYGVVLEGEIEMCLDDGVTRLMKRGDVAVQRATYHGWRNTSKTEWVRMLFVLQGCQKVLAGGKELGEDVSEAADQDGLASGSNARKNA